MERLAIGKEAKSQWYLYLLSGILKVARLENPRGMDLLVDGSITLDHAQLLLSYPNPTDVSILHNVKYIASSGLGTRYPATVYANKLKSAGGAVRARQALHRDWGRVMDQAISFLARPGKVRMMEFNPIAPSNVSLPAGTHFVISNCLVEANKTACLRGVQPMHDRMAPGGSGALQKERDGGCPTRRARLAADSHTWGSETTLTPASFTPVRRCVRC